MKVIALAAEKNITGSFFSNSLNIFATRFLSTLANLVVVIYFSHRLSRPDYGRYGSFWVQLNVGIIIASCGFALIAFTYKPQQLFQFLRQLHTRYHIIYLVFVLVCGCLFAFLLQENNVTHFGTGSIWVPVLFFVLYTIAFLLDTMLIVLQQFIPLLFISILYPVIFLYFHWRAAEGAVFSLEQLMQWLLLLVAAKVITGTLFAIKGIRKLGLSDSSGAEPLSAAAVKKLWLHLGVYDVAQMAFRSADKLIISLIASAEALAIYYNGSQDIPFLPVFLASVRSASLIQLSQSGGSAEDAINIFRKASAVLSTVAFAALTYVMSFHYEIIVTLFSEKYIPAIPVFICSMLIIPAQFCSPVFFILQNRQKGAVINKGAILDMALAIILMLPLYNIWGPLGITISIVIAAYCQTGYYLYHAARALGRSIYTFIPTKDWARKLAIFGATNITIHYICRGSLQPLYTLIAGGAVTALLALWLLSKEYRIMNNGIYRNTINDKQP